MLPPFCPPGSAGPFGRNRGGPFGGRRGRRLFDSGALRLVVLGLIADEPRHGYDIIRGLKGRFQGAYSPSPGAIYPILGALKDAGFVTSQSWGPKKLFTITPAGRDWLASQKIELDAINAQIEAAATPIGEQGLGEAIRALRAALFARMRRGALTPKQAAALVAVLRKARDDIEKI